MNRRGFLSLLGAGVAGVALDQAIPFNRVWSFPKEIVVARPATVRFSRVWDMNRLDVLYGVTPEFLLHETEEQIRVPRESLVRDAVEILCAKHDIPSLRSLEPVMEHLARRSGNFPEVRGIWYDAAPRLKLNSP